MDGRVMATEKTKGSNSESSELKEALEQYSAYEDHWNDFLIQAADDMEFRAGEQWPGDIRRQRENDPYGARPCLTFDRTNQYVRQVTNDARQNRPAIKVRPVDSRGDMAAAKLLQGMTRYIEDRSRASVAYLHALDWAVTSGLGWFRILPEIVDEEQNLQEIRVRRIFNPLSVLSDDQWTEPDGSDLKDVFIVDQMPIEEFRKKYPDVDVTDWPETSYNVGWKDRDSVRIAERLYICESEHNEIYTRDGRTMSEDEYWQEAKGGTRPEILGNRLVKRPTVEWYKLTAGQVLERTMFPARSIPVIPIVGNEFLIDGCRSLSGMIKAARDPQRVYNYARSSFTEMVALAPKQPFLAAEGQLEGHEQLWKQMNTRNVPVLFYKQTDVEGRPANAPARQPMPSAPNGLLADMNVADKDIQASFGMHDASVGATSNERSGKAIQARQHQGDVATFHYIDNMHLSVQAAGRIIIDMIPEIYDTRRMARVIGDDMKETSIIVDPDQKAPARTVQTDSGPTEVLNPGYGEYDVTVQAGPSYSTMRQEASDALLDLTKNNPNLMPVLGHLMFKMMDWPMAEEVSKMFELVAPEPIKKYIEQKEAGAEIPPAVANKMQEIEANMKKALDIVDALKQQNEKLTKALDDATTKVELDTRKLQIEEFNADTKRLQTVQAAMGPEEIQALVLNPLQQLLTPTDMAGQVPQPPQGMPPQGMPPQGMPPQGVM